MLVDAHRLLAFVTAAGALVLAVAAIAARMLGPASADPGRRRTARLWLDRAVLAALATITISVLSGIWVLASGGTPADPLHFVYAGAALVTVPVARAWATGANDGRRWLAMAVAAVVLGGLVYRLFVTGSG